MIPKLLIALLFAPVFSGNAVLAQENKEPMVQHQFDHPEQDAALAIAAGDFSLRGVMRFAAIIPGVSGDYTKLTTKYKVIILANTSDVVILNDPKDYNNMAAQYAFTYNGYILDRLGCNHESPLDKCMKYP
jgi:hypothetical protein